MCLLFSLPEGVAEQGLRPQGNGPFTTAVAMAC